MPKYHINVKPAPPRFLPPGKYVLIDREEGCLGCKYCVKKLCPYGVYNKREFDSIQLRDTIDYYCRNCLYCVEACPGGTITLMVNPTYLEIGDSYWKPEIITKIWRQAETGMISVSGAGYRGPFAGSGFDDMWTDMSEIVRPTRDGIHGREYISTDIEIGRKLSYLAFDAQGKLASSTPPLIEIPIPMLFSLPGWGKWGKPVLLSMAKAAKTLNTLFIIPLAQFTKELHPYIDNLGIYIDSLEEFSALPKDVKIIEIPYNLSQNFQAIKTSHSQTIVMIKIPLSLEAKQRSLTLTKNGAEVFHFSADDHGLEFAEKPRFIKDIIKDIHLSLVDEGTRDEVTVLVSGGIAMAEHVAKTTICGADGVILDQVLMVALECRLCKDCLQGIPCPIDIENIEPDWGAQRLINLMNAWRDQLLEVLGAMGMRDVRRLRGEMGRAIFYKDVLNEAFASIKRK